MNLQDVLRRVQLSKTFSIMEFCKLISNTAEDCLEHVFCRRVLEQTRVSKYSCCTFCTKRNCLCSLIFGEASWAGSIELIQKASPILLGDISSSGLLGCSLVLLHRTQIYYRQHTRADDLV